MWITLLYGSIVGVSLGLTGGGGSIFAVPLLVYGLGFGLRSAVAMSLAIVGVTALYGAILQARSGIVLWRAGAILGAGGIIAAPIGAWIGALLPDSVSLLLFAGLMLAIGLKMVLRGEISPASLAWISCQRHEDGKPRFSLSCAGKLLAAGGITGVLSGIFGVGGGFLVVPALLIVATDSMEIALATSLIGIFIIASAGFAANAAHLVSSAIPVAFLFLAGALLGMSGGAYFKTFLPARTLRVVFGVSVMATAVYIIFRNLKSITL